MNEDADVHEQGRCKTGASAGVKPTIRDVTVPLTKVVQGQITCLFFGKRGLALQLNYKGSGHPTASMYEYNQFSSLVLDQELSEVQRILGVTNENGGICKLPNDVFVYVYAPKAPLACSSVRLSMTKEFFTFHMSKETLPESNLDVTPFMYNNADLLRLAGEDVVQITASASSSGTVGKYAWAASPSMSWAWHEHVWAERLLGCLESAPALSGITVIPAFRWAPKVYKTHVSSIFQKVMALPVAPFQGMTDILLVGKCNVGLIATTDVDGCVLCIELGNHLTSTYSITIGSSMHSWPEKFGELLSSVYYYGTCNYLNNLHYTPPDVTWEAYGIFAMRGGGCVVVKMVLDGIGCHVHLIHEDSLLTLGSAIEFVAKKIG